MMTTKKKGGARRSNNAPQPREGSTTKLTMKYLELDPDNEFTISVNKDGLDDYAIGELYQVTAFKKTDLAFSFTGVKSMEADLTLTLTAEQHDILKQVIAIQDFKSIEEYVNHAVLAMMKADVDGCFGSAIRERALKVLEQED
jgi:hypothetical protein